MLSLTKISGLFSPDSTREATPRRRTSLALESLEGRDLMSGGLRYPIPPVQWQPTSVPPVRETPPWTLPSSHF